MFKTMLIYILKLLIRSYQKVVSPTLHVVSELLGWASSGTSGCRFHTTCSEYAIQAIEKKGIFLGSKAALKRLFRCHPWGGCGMDPVQ